MSRLRTRLERLEIARGPTTSPPVVVCFLTVGHSETYEEALQREYGGVPPERLIVIKNVEADMGRPAAGFIPLEISDDVATSTRCP